MLQQRRMPSVHLVGSSILTCTRLELGFTQQRQHRSSVLTRVLLTLAALRLNGAMSSDRTPAAICMTGD